MLSTPFATNNFDFLEMEAPTNLWEMADSHHHNYNNSIHDDFFGNYLEPVAA